MSHEETDSGGGSFMAGAPLRPPVKELRSLRSGIEDDAEADAVVAAVWRVFGRIPTVAYSYALLRTGRIA